LTRIEFRANPIHPPRLPTIRANSHQVVVLKQLRKDTVLVQSYASVAVKKQNTASRRLTGRLKDLDLSVIDTHRRPTGKNVGWWRLE
jgi:hypothetical protein